MDGFGQIQPFFFYFSLPLFRPPYQPDTQHWSSLFSFLTFLVYLRRLSKPSEYQYMDKHIKSLLGFVKTNRKLMVRVKTGVWENIKDESVF